MRNFKENSQKISYLLRKVGPKLFVKWVGIIQWALIPIVIFVVVENSLKKMIDTKPVWYASAERIAEFHPVDFLFIGSSRVGAAIDNNTFKDSMSEYLGKNVISINLGQGYSTIHEHYLGLRSLFQKYPASFENVTVFIESSAGMANIKYYKKWSDEWVNPEGPQLIVSLLRPPDIFPFLKSGSDTPGDKMYVAFKYYMNRIKMIRFRERIKEKIDTKGIGLIDKFFRSSLHVRAPNIPKKADLSESGGIKLDPHTIMIARESAVNFANELLQNQEPFQQWDKTVLADFIHMIRSHNGNVLFFDMPSSPAFSKVFATKIHENNKAVFKRQLKEWNTIILYPAFSYSDDDFPDSWHLRHSRSSEFSKKLAAEYIKFLKTHSN